MEPFETFDHAGFVCELHQDEEPVSPAEWDTLGVLYAFERDAPGEDAPGDVGEAWNRERAGLIVRYLRAQGLHAVLCRFADYGSSGARIRPLDDDEDARATGYLACPVEKMRTDGPVDGDWRRALEGELRNWDAWVSGEVCGFVVRDRRTGDVVESCWGFYPDDGPGDGLDYLRDEARATAEAVRHALEARRRETQRGWAMAHRFAAAL